MPIFPCSIPMTARSHAGYGQSVYKRAPLEKAVPESVTLKEDTAGFKLVSNHSGLAMELSYIGSGLISTLKNASKQNSTLKRGSGLDAWGAGRSALRDSITGLPSCSTFTALIRAANRQQYEEYLALVHPEDRGFMEQGIQKMLTDHRGFDFTKRIVRPDGQIRHVRCVGVPVTDGVTFH